MQTKLTLTIDHTRPIPELCDLVAGRAYTLQHVEGVESAIVADWPTPCKGDRFAELNELVVKWASDRHIVQNSNVLAQAKKSHEEAGEIIEAASAMEVLHGLAMMQAMASKERAKMYAHWFAKYKDAIGDTMVTLLVGCATAGINPLDCLQLAYDEIKDRKGTLRSDGVFVKDA